MAIELATLSASLLALVLETFWEGGIKLFGQLAKDLDEHLRQNLYEASGQYVDRYTKRHGTLKVLEMSKPMELDSLYTGTRLLEKPKLRSLESLEHFETLYQELSQRNFNLLQTLKHDGLHVVNENQYLVVLGGPGAGKSTFLRKVGLEALKSNDELLSYRCIPVLLELKQLNLKPLNLEFAIASEFEICGFPSSSTFVIEALKQGRLLILLDGLDEIPQQNRSNLVSALQDFVDRYHKNHFILSCRTPAYVHPLRQFTDFEVSDFDEPQMKAFIQNWFSSELDQQANISGKLWELLRQPDNLSTKELAKTPLLLAFICLVYDRDMSLPDNRGLLYGKALDILLRRWSAERRIERDLIYKGLYPELEKLLLSEIAHYGLINGQLFFHQQHLLEQIQRFLSETLDAPSYLDGEVILTAIQEQQGILVRQAENIFSFSHLTLQEYLAARYVAADSHRITELVSYRLHDPYWQEVFLLVAGLTTTGDELLLKIEAEARKYIDTPRLAALITWASQITRNDEGVSGSLIQRIFAILIALTLSYNHTFTRALTLLRTLAFSYDYDLVDELDIAQTQAYTLAGDFDLDLTDLTYELARNLKEVNVFEQVNLTLLTARMDAIRLRVQQWKRPQKNEALRHLWLNSFNLKPEQVDLSKAEIEKLENYLNANLLILKCKRASVRVLRTTWEQIEKRMLLAKH